MVISSKLYENIFIIFNNIMHDFISMSFMNIENFCHLISRIGNTNVL